MNSVAQELTLWCTVFWLALTVDHGLGFTFPTRKFLISPKRTNGLPNFVGRIAASSNNDLFAPQPKDKKQKKKKKNKYAKFSKADKVTEDPFQALVKESKEKLNQLKDEDHRQKTPTPTPQEVKPIEFPDNKNINPYDPATFGYIEIGTIQGPHGVHGWVKVQGSTDFPERLTTAGMLLHMKLVNKRAPRKVTLMAGKSTGTDSFLVQLEGMLDRSSVQKLKGATLYYATQQDTIIEEEGILVTDMVGLQVRLEEGDLVGTVDAVVLADEMCAIPGLGHDMLEVALVPHQDKPIGAPNDLVLIPYVPEIVPCVSVAEREITIDPPGGLLDLTYIRENKVRIKGLLAPAED